MGHGGLVAPPARQGPGSLSADAVAALDLAFARRAGGVLPGDHRGTGVGAGTELAQLRALRARRRRPPARPGRQRAHARRARPPARPRAGADDLDRPRRVGLDGRSGPPTRLKSDVAEGVAVVLARLAVRRGGRVAALACGGPVVRLLPPRGGRRALASVQRLAAEGVAPDGLGDDGGLADGLWRVRPPGPARPAWSSSSPTSAPAGGSGALRSLRARHSVLAVEVGDPREDELPDAGHLVLVDPETGRARRGRHDVGRGCARASPRRRPSAARRWPRRCAAPGAEHVRLSTDGDWLRELARRVR